MSFREEEIVVLIDEDGVEVEFEIIEIFEINENKYAFLFPIAEEDDEAVIMKIQKENEEDVLVDIEDDEEWNAVVEAWEEIIDELESEEQDFEPEQQ